MRPPTQTPARIAILAVFAAAVLAIPVAPLPAQTSVQRTWNEEHAELIEQIDRLKTSDEKWRNRLAAQALDREALILPTDKDPLDVVLGRGQAFTL